MHPKIWYYIQQCNGGHIGFNYTQTSFCLQCKTLGCAWFQCQCACFVNMLMYTCMTIIFAVISRLGSNALKYLFSILILNMWNIIDILTESDVGCDSVSITKIDVSTSKNEVVNSYFTFNFFDSYIVSTFVCLMGRCNNISS